MLMYFVVEALLNNSFVCTLSYWQDKLCSLLMGIIQQRPFTHDDFHLVVGKKVKRKGGMGPGH